jgi:hypothetical protein
MHRREHVHPARGEDSRNLRDHAVGIGYEHERVLMEDDVELTVAEGAQVAHVGTQIFELGTAAPRETAHCRDLPAADVHERRSRAELGEDNGVPATAAGKREHALSVEVDAFERAVRDAIEEPTFPGFCPRWRALRSRVRDASLGEPFPHALVVRGNLIDRDASCHGEIVAA